jgi:hypothetical protein
MGQQEKEKGHLEKEESRRREANSGRVEGEVYNHKDNTESDNVVKTHTQSATDKQESGTSHESPINAQEELAPDSFPQDINSIITMLLIVFDQIHSNFKQARELILEIAKRLDEGRLCERSQISRTLKKILRDKIQEGKVTEKWIEECLPPEYKRMYVKSELSSLSKQKKQQLVGVSTGGKQTLLKEQDDDKGIDRLHDESNQNGFAESKKESTVTSSTKQNDEIESPTKQNEGLTDTEKVLVSHISMSFEKLRKDMNAVSQRTKGTGNVFWKLSVDLATRVAKIEFCGITQDATMTSIGKGELKEA